MDNVATDMFIEKQKQKARNIVNLIKMDPCGVMIAGDVITGILEVYGMNGIKMVDAFSIKEFLDAKIKKAKGGK